MTTTRTENLFPNVPLPAGVSTASDWYDPDKIIGEPPDPDNPDTQRWFRGASWIVQCSAVREQSSITYCVAAAGAQYVDGRVTRWVELDDKELTAQQARQLAAALTAAADEVDRLTAL